MAPPFDEGRFLRPFLTALLVTGAGGLRAGSPDTSLSLGSWSGKGAVPTPWPTDFSGRRAVIADCVGPVSSQGSGLRNMAVIQDLVHCGYRVDLVIDPCRCEQLDMCHNRTKEGFGWSKELTTKYLTGYLYDTGADPTVDWGSYDLIVMFAWTTRPFPGDKYGVPNGQLERLAAFRNRTVAIFDDVPSHRCYELCDQVDKYMLRWHNAASIWYMLHEQDLVEIQASAGMRQLKRLAMVPKLDIWPFRLSNLAEQMPMADTRVVVKNKTYITMVANGHGENQLAVELLFKNGFIDAMCNATAPSGSRVKVLFVGSINKVVKAELSKRGRSNNISAMLHNGHAEVDLSQCVDSISYVSDDALYTEVLPQTLAILNPFPTDLLSGISMKSHLALVAGLPLITSEYGLRGLPSCGVRTLPPNLEGIDAMVLDLVTDLTGALQRSQSAYESCREKQEEQYPAYRQCAFPG